MLTPSTQPRGERGRFASVRNIDAPARSILYREAYAKIWLAETKADPERYARYRKNCTRAIRRWRAKRKK